MKITCLQGSLLDVEAQVIVNAANSHGLMGGGVAGIIRRAAGSQVEEEARRQAPIPVGQAVLTSGGRTRFAGIIHAPTMPEPAMRIPVENVRLATRAALQLADEHGFVTLAIPGMGTGVGRVRPEDAAQGMVEEIRQFQPRSLQSVMLVDIDPEMVRAWQAALSSSVALEDEFCDIVKKARRGSGQSIAHAAETAHLRKDEWERLEQGARPPSEHEVQAMAQALALKGGALAAVSVGGWVPQPSPEWVSSLVVTVLGDIGGYEVKGYVLIDPETKRAVCVDTAYNAEAMLAVLAERQATLAGVCLTHGHMDHAGGLDRILSEWPVPVYLGEGDFPLLPWKPPQASLVVTGDARVLAVGDLGVECLATPGHTPGGICYRVQTQGRALCFVGDTLFAGSVGGSNPPSLYGDHLTSVRGRVLQLDPDTVLLPGHGPPTTVREERVTNPFG
ncbi:MAG: macro domain-containing protein [Nitrospira sp.]|nr:macro domain-containing protein [Nitrospira sp.]